QCVRGRHTIAAIVVLNTGLSKYDSHAAAVAPEIVPDHFGLEAVAAPHAVLAAPGAVRDDLVAAEGGLDAVRRRIADVVAVEEVVVRATRPRVHRRLARPQENAVTAVRQR